MRKIIRYIAIVLNILVFIVTSIILLSGRYDEKPHALLFLLFSIINLIALILPSYSNHESWLSLYLQRKALEEKKKVNALITEVSTPNDTNDTKNVS
jgi:hypothetical protein